jgi:putative DNA primase/helicase
VKNGTLDLATGKLQPHNKSDMLTKMADVVYDPAATAPRWEQFLLEIMGGNPLLVDYLRRVVGYTLTASTREQVLFFLYGSGANGKSTFLRALNDLFGRDYACNAPSELLLARNNGSAPHPAEKAYLFGKRLVCASEAGEGHRLAEALIKQLTGEDMITARRMYENFWEFTPSHKIFFAANHKPIVHGTDLAIWRRIRLIPFDVTFQDYQQDKDLALRLKSELPGILAWAVRGCSDWRQYGLMDPKEVLVATAGYRNEMDLIGDFIEVRCDVATGQWATATELYSNYVLWCEENGEEPIKQRTFGLKLGDKGFIQSKGSHGIRIWKGLGIKTQYIRNGGGSQFSQE